eukprot:Phypoly_transcript_14819.p1 GENE.Phypoly_transcript_14819~~Phypoly_transcript_14819.p1  ORF type:complete len:230 (+),score=30.69 Phypoly_transcript_14819:136-825(+)
MAWRCSAATNAGLIANMKAAGLISSRRVEQAMLAVDRGSFTHISPYDDSPQPLGFGATISAPHMHAEMLELLEPFLKPGDRALDVGSGSGYLAACMAKMVTEGGATGKVIGVEHVSELVTRSKQNVRKADAELLNSGSLELIAADGRKGWPAFAPYSAIHVGAASPDDIPQALMDQLAPGGRMVIPVGPQGGDQYLVQVDKDINNKITTKRLLGVRFVPLTGREDQPAR